MHKIYIVMGVSASGKTTIGKNLADTLDLAFYDADDFHPLENVQKMAAGQPLEDSDRWPWLQVLASKIKEWAAVGSAVLACSALKESYRQVLMEGNSAVVEWIYLDGSEALIRERSAARSGHFMKAELVRSQFLALEIPTYGHHISIDDSPKHIIQNILRKIKSMQKSTIGLIGLGVMGSSLSLNIAEKGHTISVFNRSTPGEDTLLPNFMMRVESGMQVAGFSDLKEFVASLALPRKILIMVKAGQAIDQINAQLLPLLDESDIVVDCGNSHYEDTKRRSDFFKEKNLHFVGCGVSGGEEGARRGPSIMPGGSLESYAALAPILESISAKDSTGKPCCAHIGPDGAGHFVKMVHNGIEYVEMQLLAEVYALLSLNHSKEKIAKIFRKWNTGPLASYLLEITADILVKKEGDDYVLDLILDKAGNKGTGSWSSKAAFDLGSVNSLMASAVFARYISSFKEKRSFLSQFVDYETTSDLKIGKKALKKAYTMARILNHQQGFALINQASDTYNWDLNLSETARIWTNGCIIRSAFMIDCIQYFQSYSDLFDQAKIVKKLKNTELEFQFTLADALDYRIPTPCLSESYQYWMAITTERLPANIIQAQRDYFGAHTYQRVDASANEFFHTKWV